MKKITFLLAIVCQVANAQSWQQIADFPGTARDDGTSFIINNKAYCGTGFEVGFAATRDFYVFDMYTNAWQKQIMMPAGNERQYACGFSNAGKGYIFGGVNGNNFYADLWEFDPVANTWKSKKPKPGAGLSGASLFEINGLAYISGGKNSSTIASTQVWCYDAQKDYWEPRKDFPFGGRWRAAACNLNGKGYLGFGKDEKGAYHNEIYEYDTGLDSWTLLTKFPGKGRTYAALTALYGKLYVVAGLDSSNNFYNDLWEYDLAASAWTQLQSMPGIELKGGMCFNSNSTIYYTAGIEKTGNRLKSTYAYAGLTNISVITKKGLLAYPNPFSTELFIDKANNSKQLLQVADINGKIIFSTQITQKQTRLQNLLIDNGIYFILLDHKPTAQLLRIGN